MDFLLESQKSELTAQRFFKSKQNFWFPHLIHMKTEFVMLKKVNACNVARPIQLFLLIHFPLSALWLLCYYGLQNAIHFKAPRQHQRPWTRRVLSAAEGLVLLRRQLKLHKQDLRVLLVVQAVALQQQKHIFRCVSIYF